MTCIIIDDKHDDCFTHLSGGFGLLSQDIKITEIVGKEKKTDTAPCHFFRCHACSL